METVPSHRPGCMPLALHDKRGRGRRARPPSSTILDTLTQRIEMWICPPHLRRIDANRLVTALRASPVLYSHIVAIHTTYARSTIPVVLSYGVS